MAALMNTRADTFVDSAMNHVKAHLPSQVQLSLPACFLGLSDWSRGPHQCELVGRPDLLRPDQLAALRGRQAATMSSPFEARPVRKG